ncbi:MAG: hypothetical protein NTV21_18415 [Planctomycetota bacterium]|nr:hypothetical protein [Planctomycetota bacterium]
MNSRFRGLLVGLALLALAVVAYLVISSRGPEPAGALEREELAESAAATPTAEKSSATASDETRQAERALVAKGTAVEPQLEPHSGLELVAVTGVDRRRVAEAELTWIPLEQDPIRDAANWLMERIRKGELDRWMQTRGVRLAPDAEGRRFAPDVQRAACVVAIAPGLYGALLLRPSASGLHEIELESDSEQLVKVVDAKGAAVEGVGVMLNQTQEFRGFAYASALTGVDGIAHLRNLRRLLQGDRGFEMELLLTAEVPAVEPVELAYDPWNPPREMPVLRLPPTGSVEVEIDVEGLPPGTELQLQARSAPASEGRGRVRGPTLFAAIVDGSARFPVVGLNLELELRPIFEDSFPLPPELRAGPTREGELVKLRLGGSVLARRARGRLVDDLGRPFAGVSMYWTLEYPPDAAPAQQWLRARTDADGSFEMTLVGQAVDVVLKAVMLEPAPGRSGAYIATALAWSANAEVDFGNVVLPLHPLVASGTVVNRHGQPIAGAEVQGHPAGPEVDRRPDVAQRLTQQMLFAKSDELGRFEIRSDSPSTKFQLSAGHENARSAQLLLQRGTEGVVLTIQEDASLRGQLLLDATLGAAELEVVLLRPRLLPDGRRLGSLEITTKPDAEGHFRFQRLAEGTYGLQVRATGLEQELVKLSEIAVESGRETTDPRLSPLDLREFGPWRLLRVLTPEGSVAKRVYVLRTEGDKADTPYVRSSPGRHVRYSLREPPFWLSVENALLERFDPALGDTTVQLRPAQELQVSVHPDSPWPDGCVVRVQFVGADEPEAVRQSSPDEAEFFSKAAVTTVVRRTGQLAVTAWLESNRNVELPAEVTLGGFVHVRPGPQRLEVRWTREDLDRALAEAKR